MASMGRVNFHYLLGYARNYRMLSDQGAVPADDLLHRLLAIVDADPVLRHLSVVVFRALRQLEWHLRALLDEHHRSVFPSDGSYHDHTHYKVPDTTLPRVPDLLTKHITRSRGPFVVEHLGTGRTSRGSSGMGCGRHVVVRRAQPRYLQVPCRNLV